MSHTPLFSAPHAHQATSIRRTMWLVILALLPATVYGLYLFGWPALNLFVVTVASALLAEAFSLRLAGKAVKPFLFDGSALLTGWLLALTLPPWAPWWIGVVGALLAIVIGKQVFGGIGQNLFNPAMVARVALLISFPLEMTTFLTPLPMFSANAPSFVEGLAISFSQGINLDAVSSASLLGHVKTELGQGHLLPDVLTSVYDLKTLLSGNTPGSLGETSALLILVGGLLLLFLRIISWHIPLAMLGTLAMMATFFHWLDPAHYPDAVYHLFSGAAMLGAFFIATDLVTSPVTARGQLLFGAGCGLLVYIIRTWAAYPEGVAFAVLLMNATTPLIDHYLKPRIYGRRRDGSPLQHRNRLSEGGGT